MLFLLISFLYIWFTGIAIIRRIRFLQWWVWRWWVWIRVSWYVLEGPVPAWAWVVVLGGIPMVFLTTGIFLTVSFRFTTWGSLRTPVALRVAPVTISLWRTACTTCKGLPLVATPSVFVWLTNGMTPWIVAGISLFVYNLCGEFPFVVSVSVIFISFLSLVWVYQLIAFWIAFGDIYVWMIICTLVDCWFKRQSIKPFYSFCQTVRINSPVVCNVYFLSWCIGCDRGMNESLRSHVIGVTFFVFRLCHYRIYCLSKFIFWKWCLWTIIMFHHSFQQIHLFSSFWVAIHNRSYVRSSLFKRFPPHLNILK